MKYPGSEDEIEDPSPRLPAEVARLIAPIIPEAVVCFRKDETERRRISVLAKAAVDVLEILVPRRLPEAHANIESLRRALAEDADTALAFAHHIYKTAGPGNGRMLWLWHQEIERQLHFSEKRASIETEWWELQADSNPTSPVAPPPVPTKAPRTATAARIEKFIDDVYQAKEVRIDKMDIWLVAGYHSDKEFRAFQREKASAAVHRKFNSVLKMEPQEFIEKRDIKRKTHADRKAKRSR